MRAQHRLNFSLVELLVVITMLSLLASMLIPTVTRMRRKADRTACQNNIRQLGLAYKMYADDFNAFPSSYFAKPFKRNIPLMMHASAYDSLRDDYQFDHSEHRCPSATLDDVTYTKKNRTPRYGYLSYANYAGMEAVGKGRPQMLTNTAEGIDDGDADHILSADLLVMYRNQWSRSLDYRGGTVNHRGDEQLPEGINVLFVDGRVEWRRQQEIDISKPSYEYREGRHRYFW